MGGTAADSGRRAAAQAHGRKSSSSSAAATTAAPEATRHLNISCGCGAVHARQVQPPTGAAVGSFGALVLDAKSVVVVNWTCPSGNLALVLPRARGMLAPACTAGATAAAAARSVKGSYACIQSPAFREHLINLSPALQVSPAALVPRSFVFEDSLPLPGPPHLRPRNTYSMDRRHLACVWACLALLGTTAGGAQAAVAAPRTAPSACPTLLTLVESLPESSIFSEILVALGASGALWRGEGSWALVGRAYCDAYLHVPNLWTLTTNARVRLSCTGPWHSQHAAQPRRHCPASRALQMRRRQLTRRPGQRSRSLRAA